VNPPDDTMNKPLLPALSLAAAIPAAVVAASTPDIQLETVGDMSRFNQAAWWSPIIHDANTNTTYLAYLHESTRDGYDDVYVAARDANGHWTTTDTEGDAYFDSGHTQASLALDADGFLHVVYGIHTNPIKFRVSNAPGSIADGFTYKPNSEPFDGGYYTYQNMTTAPDGSIYMVIRDYPDGEFWKHTPADGWSQVATFAQDDGSAYDLEHGTTVYPDHAYADPSGDIHLVWEWAAGGANPARHHGSYARYSPATDTFYKADGSAYDATPISVATSDVFQGLENGEEFRDDSYQHGFQSAKMTVDDNNHPLIAYAYPPDQNGNHYEHRLARWDDDLAQWVVSTVSEGPFAAEKPWIAYSDGVLRYYTMLGSDDPRHTGSDDIWLFTSTDLGDTWADPVQVTDGLDIQRPVGTSVDGVDYLYLPSVTGETLYFATVSVPEPSVLGVAGSAAAPLLLHRKRRTP